MQLLASVLTLDNFEPGMIVHTVLATQEVEIGRMVVLLDPTSANNELDVVHACHPSYSGNINRSIVVQDSLGMYVRPYSKITKAKKAGGVFQR
jgi:hypothetical protein